MFNKCSHIYGSRQLRTCCTVLDQTRTQIQGIVMANNLLISYDLNSPGQDYEKVFKAIKSLGSWARPQKSFWYVKSIYSAADAATIVWKSMDNGDSLIVVDATHNTAAWFGISTDTADFLKGTWIS